MRIVSVLCASAGLSMFATNLSAQVPARVDFARDVLPVFRQNCVSCHGPAQQNSGLRLDRRSSVMNGGQRRVVPGNSANSFLYHRIADTDYGPMMPPTGPLRPEQVATIKTWIEQGADWPDSLANEADLPPIDPKAVQMVEMLRTDRNSFMKRAAENAKLLNARGPEGSTPFMYAVLYCDVKTLDRLLELGADVNARNDVNATALMWAAADYEKTRLLLDRGAEVNARSNDLRTPLMIAARRPGGARTVKLLLDRGANPDPNANPIAESSPLTEAATAGDAETMELLIARGARVKAAGQHALAMAIAMRCSKCLDLLVAGGPDRDSYTGALAEVAVLGDVSSIRILLDHGADVNAFDPLGRTPLMYAAGSDLLPVDAVKLLIDRGADVNAIDRHKQAGDAGLSVLDIARLRGDTPVVDLLVKSGAKGAPPAPETPSPRRENSIQNAIAASLPLIQAADASFAPKTACVSCHNNSLAAMAVSVARKRGFRVNEQIAAQQVKVNSGALARLRDNMHQGFFVPTEDTFGPDVLAYVLIGLHEENYKPDLSTDAVAMYIRVRQMTDGHWEFGAADQRPPLCSEYIGQTVLSMRALQLYAPESDKSGYDRSVALAARWLGNARSKTNDDRAWRLIGLTWAAADRSVIGAAVRELLATQRADGGWSDIPSMRSNPYATGKALAALRIAGTPASDAACERAIRFLLDSQQPDGSWRVRTRALAFQPYFDSGFPHGFDQFISAAGTSWATMALALSSERAGRTVAVARGAAPAFPVAPH